MNKATLQARQLLISLSSKSRRNGIKQKHFCTANIKSRSFVYEKTLSLFFPLTFQLFYSDFSFEHFNVNEKEDS